MTILVKDALNATQTVKTINDLISEGLASTAGEAHIGEVGGNTRIISVSPTLSSSPDYVDGDVIGGKLSISEAARVSGGSGIVHFLSISSKVDITVGLRILFFKSDPSNTTFTDNAAFGLDSLDYDKLLGHIDVESSEWIDLGTPNLVTKANINVPYQLASGTTLYAVAVARGTINIGSSSDLTFNFGCLRD
jgi:hypothetical protein